MAGEGVKTQPEESPVRLSAGAIRAAVLWAAGLLLAAFLIWRVTVVLLTGAKAEDAAAERPVKNPPAAQTLSLIHI